MPRSLKSWIYHGAGITLCFIAAFVHAALPHTASTTKKDEVEKSVDELFLESRGRYEAYLHLGILPDDLMPKPTADEKKATTTTAKTTTYTPHQDRHLRSRRQLESSSSAWCTICSLTPNFRGRFGASSFDSTALQLPGKKGAAFTLRDDNWEQHMKSVKFLNPSWNYSWGSKRLDSQPSHIEFVPMIWHGTDKNRVEEILDSDVRPQYEAGKIHRLLGFNEPNLSEQANMDVNTAVELWPALESIDIPLAGPSVSSQGIASWMRDWNDYAFKYSLRLDYVAIHWYNGPNITNFQSYLQHMYELNGGKTPLWITEFAPADWSATSPETNRYSMSRVLDFMKEALPWLEEQDWIVGYAWFPFTTSFAPGATSALFDEKNDPTPLGLYYASVTPDNPYGDQSISIDS